MPSAPSLPHDLSGMLARPSTPCQHTAHACLPPHTLCMPAPLAHTPVTRYSTRHSRPKPSKSSSCSYNHLPLGSPAVAACAAQAVLSLPQQARASTWKTPPCAPSRDAKHATPHAHAPAIASTPTRRHVARVYVSRPHNPPCLLPGSPCPRRVSLDITGPPLSFRPCRTEPTAPTGNHGMTRAGIRFTPCAAMPPPPPPPPPRADTALCM